MKKSKFFFGLAAFALAIGAFLTTKANKKFATFSVKIANESNLTGTLTANTVKFTTVNALGTLKTAFLRTVSGSYIKTIVTATNGFNKVFVK